MLKKSKALKKGVKDHRARSDDDDADNDDQDWDMYEKAKPMPGQLENCEICDKRFTVTPYSKSGPEGGLLCTKCGKEIDLQKKKEAKANKPPIVRAKRRKMQSNLMDDVVTKGAKSLQELCVEVRKLDSIPNEPWLSSHRKLRITSTMLKSLGLFRHASWTASARFFPSAA